MTQINFENIKDNRQRLFFMETKISSHSVESQNQIRELSPSKKIKNDKIAHGNEKQLQKSPHFPPFFSTKHYVYSDAKFWGEIGT